MSLEQKGIPGIHYPLPPGCVVVKETKKANPLNVIKWCRIIQNFVTPSQARVIDRVISNIKEDSEEEIIEGRKK